MRVKKLIKLLKEMPPEMKVKVGYFNLRRPGRPEVVKWGKKTVVAIPF